MLSTELHCEGGAGHIVTLPPREEAQELYERESLPLPPVPAPFAGAELYHIGRATFATTQHDLDGHADLYDLDRLLTALLSHEIATPVLAYGFGGHGVASQAVHYYAATEHAIVLVQARWGCYLDADDSGGNPQALRDAFAAACEDAAVVVEAAETAAAQGVLPAGQRLVAVDSFRSGKVIAWLDAAPIAADEVDYEEAPPLPWQQSIAPMLVAHARLLKLMKG